MSDRGKGAWAFLSEAAPALTPKGARVCAVTLPALEEQNLAFLPVRHAIHRDAQGWERRRPRLLRACGADHQILRLKPRSGALANERIPFAHQQAGRLRSQPYGSTF